MSEHLSDEEIQECVLNKFSNQHVQNCALCKEKVEAYQLIITAIEQEPAPVLDFDISELVLAKIETKRSRNVWMYVLAAACVLITALAIYLFRKDIAVVFNGISTFLIFLLAIPGLFILVVMIADQFRNYKDRLQQINQQAVS